MPAFLIPSAYAQAPAPVQTAQAPGAATLDALRGLLAGVSGSSALGHIGVGVGAVPRTVQQKLAERVAVEDFGAVGDGATDDTRAFNQALAAAAARGWGTIVTRSNTDYRTTGLVTVPTGTTLRMGDGSSIVYHGNGTAVRVEPAAPDDAGETYSRGAQTQRRNLIRVVKASIGWHNAARNVDTASVGIQMVNQRYSQHDLYAVGFSIGVELVGSDSGYPSGGAHQGNIYTIYARNNRVQVLERRIGGGYVNQNVWLGGLMRNDSQYRASETRGFDGSEGANGWTFVGVNCEGNSMEQVFRFGGPYNTVLNCRFENATPGMVKVLAKGGVALVGCYIGRAGIGLIDADPGGGWTVQSEIGSWSQNSVPSSAACNARIRGASGYWQRWTTAGGATAVEWEGGNGVNRLDAYASPGKQDAGNPPGHSQPTVRFDFSGRALRFRAPDRQADTDALAASLSWSTGRYLTVRNVGLHLETLGPDQELRLRNTRLWVDGQGRLRVSRAAPGSDTEGNVLQESDAGASSRRPSAPAPGQMFFDQGLGRPIWWAGSRWVDAAGAAV